MATFQTPSKPWAARFWKYVDRAESCWLWVGGINKRGYGNFWLEGRTQSAHLVALRLAGVVIPRGYEPDHLCRVKHCVNPAHMEIVTKSVNILRQRNLNRLKTACPQGHPYTPENTYVDKKNMRHCKSCDRDRKRARKERDHGDGVPAG